MNIERCPKCSSDCYLWYATEDGACKMRVICKNQECDYKSTLLYWRLWVLQEEREERTIALHNEKVKDGKYRSNHEKHIDIL